jgi:hypothetical protein
MQAMKPARKDIPVRRPNRSRNGLRQYRGTSRQKSCKDVRQIRAGQQASGSGTTRAARPRETTSPRDRKQDHARIPRAGSFRTAHITRKKLRDENRK